MTLCTKQGIALGYGILTTETRDQAWARASRADKDKGAVAARACLQMIALRCAFFPEKA